MSSKRVIGKLNTLTSDGRMIKTLHEPDEPIPVRVHDSEGLGHTVGQATWTIEDDRIVADIIVEADFEDLTPHMEIYAVQHGHFREGATLVVDVAILKSIFLDDQPDAFGDLS